MSRRFAIRFLLPVVLLNCVFCAILFCHTYRSTREAVMQSVGRQLDTALAYNQAVRQYVTDEILPAMQKLVGPDEFMPETMSTAFVSRKIFEGVQAGFPDCVFRLSAEHPRNPANGADPVELDIIDEFNVHPELPRLTKEVIINGRPHLACFLPRRVEASCMKCHGDPADAPPAMIARYGDKAGFHLNEGSIAALDTVAVPIDTVDAKLWLEYRSHFLMIVAGIFFLPILVAVIFRLTISRQLTSVAAHFQRLAEDPVQVHIEPVAVEATDEIGVLARSFNMLCKRLNIAYASLDHRVRERTHALAEANAALARENTERKRIEAELRDQAELVRQRNQELMARQQELIAQQMQMKAVNAELNAASAAARAASCAKSEFLANMSHEIRTPMTAITGYADLMWDEVSCCTKCLEFACCAVRERARHYLSTIRLNGNHLLEVIDDILDLSKIEAGKFGVEATEVSPLTVMTEVVSLMQVRAEARGLELSMGTEGSIPQTIRSDARRIKQILLNLVGNAIKFTNAGSVRLTVRAIDDGSVPSLEFAVADTGIGLSPEQSARLFEPFSQIDGSATRQFGGTGLGLVISKRLAEMLGGGISVESELGRGSTFRVSVSTGDTADIPRVEADRHAAGSPASASCRRVRLPCRILLAEDCLDNQNLICQIMRNAGVEVVVCEDGDAAIRAALEAEASLKPFGIILMDMQMPILDGYEATRRLRDKGYRGTIVALTAHAMPEDRRKCLEAGCDEYATKPVDRVALFHLITCFLARAAELPNAGSGSEAAAVDGSGPTDN